MNNKLREGLNKTAQASGRGFSNLGQSIVSLLRMCVLSRVSVAKRARKYGNLKSHPSCTVLANGPSLKVALEGDEVILDNVDVFCVNMFCESEYFWKLKPRFYFIVDEAYFSDSPDDRNKILIEKLYTALNKVDWDMYLCISSTGNNGGVLRKLENSKIHVLRWNTTTFEGFRGLRHAIFHSQMGMPRCQTVTNFALAAAINMHYNKVYLYGADHTWTRDLFVDDDNVVCYGDRHVYNTGLTVIKHTKNMTQILSAFSNMFASHMIIRDYADAEDVKIINKTKGSFIDAYNRNDK